MITSLTAILAAFYWLMRETDWLRIRLTIDETLEEYEYMRKEEDRDDGKMANTKN